MPRFILSLRYLKMKKPSQVKNYVKYVATRPNAEKFEVNQSQREATEHQKRWIEKELKANKELRESCEQEYEDYLQNPTRENAMELINKWTIVNKKDTIFKYIFWERLDSLPIPESCFHFVWCQIA